MQKILLLERLQLFDNKIKFHLCKCAIAEILAKPLRPGYLLHADR